MTATMASSMLFFTTSIWPRKYPSVVRPDRPQQAADEVEDHERAVVHLADAGHDGGERAHHRHEPGQHDGLGAVAFEEGVGLDTCCCLNRRLSGRLNSVGPTLRPNQNPT